MRILKKQLFLIISALLISALLLVGCGKGAKQAAVNQPAESTVKAESNISAEESNEVEETDKSETTQTDTTQATFDDTTSDTVPAEVKPSSGTADKGTASSTAPSTGTNNPTGGQPTATTPPITEPSIPTDSIPPVTQGTSYNDYVCSCGFKCDDVFGATECYGSNGTCPSFVAHYKSHPEACPHAPGFIYYNPIGSSSVHQKACIACNTTWTPEPHVLTENKSKYVPGDCTTSREIVYECLICHGYTEYKSGGFQHNFGDWVFVDSPCGITPHYERYCTLCSEWEYKATDYPVTDVPHQGGTATCTARAICKWCNQPYGELSSNHNNTTVKNVREATCCAGYSGDTYCNDCGLTIPGSSIPPVRDHSYQEISRVESETELSITSQCTECGTTSKVSISIG